MDNGHRTVVGASLPDIQLDRLKALHAIRDRHSGEAGASQRARILDALETLGHLTTFEGTRHLDCYDVRARVKELRRDGKSIVTTWRHVPTESGNLHRVGVYTLAKGVQQ